MNSQQIQEASPMFEFFLSAVDWLDPLVHAAGLALVVWAFSRSGKRGYLVVGCYFAAILFSMFVLPSINRALNERRGSDVSGQALGKMDAAIRQAVDRVLEEDGHPAGVTGSRTIHFPLGPILLVGGLWLIARREGREDRPEQLPNLE